MIFFKETFLKKYLPVLLKAWARGLAAMTAPLQAVSIVRKGVDPRFERFETSRMSGRAHHTQK